MTINATNLFNLSSAVEILFTIVYSNNEYHEQKYCRNFEA